MMYRRYRIIRARFPSVCSACDGEVRAGDRVYWTRGQRPQHTDCDTARLLHDTADTGCTACSGLGVRWNNAPCPHCDGTGSRECQDKHRAILSAKGGA